MVWRKEDDGPTVIENDPLLTNAVREADLVLVVRGHSYDERHRAANEILAREDDRASIESLVVALSRSGGGDAALMTPGDPSLVFLNDHHVLAVVTCLQSSFIRCQELWSFDAKLRDPQLLTRWLRDHGI